MAAFLSEDKKQRKKNKKNKQSPTELIPDQPTPPWLSPADPFSPVSTITGRTETPPDFAPPRAPWMSRTASNDGDSSIFNGGGSTIGASSINTVRGRSEAGDGGYETDSGRSKSKSRKLRKRSKSRARKGGNGEGGYETDDGYMSSGPAPDKNLNKSKSKSRFFKLGNRSKGHVSSDDEQEPVPPLPVPQPPQPQFILPIAARFATTLGNVNRDKSVEPPLGIYPGLSGAKKQEETQERGVNRSLELNKTDSVDFSTAMNRAFANAQQQELPVKQRNDPLVRFQSPTIPPSSTSTAGPSSYHPTSSDTIGPYTRDSAGSATSSEQHPSSRTSSVAHSSTQSHGSTAPSSIASSPPTTTSPTSGTGLFSRFGSKRSADKAAKEAEKERSQISYPITRAVSPPGTSPITQHEQSMAKVPPSSYSPASSVPASGRATPTSDKRGNVPRPLFLHRVPSSDHVGKPSNAEPVQHSPEDLKPSPGPSPVGGGYVVLTPGLGGSYPTSKKVKPTPSTLIIPRTIPGPGSSPVTVTNALPSPIPSMSYIVPSPSQPTFASPAPLPIRPRALNSDENLRSRTRVSEDTFNPPPAVFTIPPATPPPNSPLPDVPPSQVGNNVFSAQQTNMSRSHYAPHSQAQQSSLLAPSVGSSRPSSPNGSSPMRGRESPFPARPTLPTTSPHRNPSVVNRKADLDGFGGRVKVKRYAELYGFQNGNGDEEDDTISIVAGGGRVPVRRDDEEEWNASVTRQREERERGRERERERIAMAQYQGQSISSPLPPSFLEPNEPEWRTHRRKQTKSTQVGIAVEEPSDDEEDEGYGGEEAYGRYGVPSSNDSVADDDDDDAGYYRRRGGFSDEDHTISDIASGPALSRSHSFEALQKRLQDPKNMVATPRRRGGDEEFSQDGHWQQTRSRSRPTRSEDDHHLVPQRPLRVPASPAASEDSHYSANSRYTMYEDEDYNSRATVYSEAGSFMDESRSRSARDRFLRRVEGMYDSTGRERVPPVPALPSSYLSNSGRLSPNPPYDAPPSQMNRLAGLATGKGRGNISPIPPVPRLPKGAVVGIVGENGEVVSSKLWI